MTGVAMHQGPPWPAFVDGSGYTLENTDPNGNPMNWRNWRRSRAAGGTPGKWTLLDKIIPTGTPPFNGPYMRDILLNSETSSMTIVLASDQEDQLRLENYQILSHPDLKPLIYLDGKLSSKRARLLIRSRDLNAIKNGESASYEFRYPRLSNQYFNVTYIHNDQTIHYDASLRESGSAWTRQANMARGKWKIPKDRPFRNHVKFTCDDDPTRQGGVFRHHNRMVRYLLYLLGHPCGKNEFLYVILNDGPVMLREEVEPVDSDYLRRNFTDGHKGEL